MALTAKREEDARKLSAFIVKEYPALKTRILTVPEINDIWIRDFGFLSGRDGEGRPLAARFIYRPAYYPENEILYAEEDYKAHY